MTEPTPGGQRFEDRVTAGPGGVMTVEVGCITGDLTVVTTDHPGGQVWVAVQYAGTDEWYTLDGMPALLPPGQATAHYHQRVLEAGSCQGQRMRRAHLNPPHRPKAARSATAGRKPDSEPPRAATWPQQTFV